MCGAHYVVLTDLLISWRSFAEELGVDVDRIELVVTAGSAVLTFTITAPSSGDALDLRGMIPNTAADAQEVLSTPSLPVVVTHNPQIAAADGSFNYGGLPVALLGVDEGGAKPPTR